MAHNVFVEITIIFSLFLVLFLKMPRVLISWLQVAA
jgi:hypothetical protein